MRKFFAIFLVLIFGLVLLTGCAASQESQDAHVVDRVENDRDQEIPLDSEPEEPSEGAVPKEALQPAVPEGQLTVHFIDVGQGDAILIQTSKQNILIDGGDRGNTVVNYLRAQGVTSLDLVIGTHPHADHLGGLINVFQAIPVNEVIDPGVVHTTKTFEDYLTLIDEKDIKFTEGRAGMTRDLEGGAVMKIIHPTSPSSSHLNDASIVVRVTFGQVSFLFTGDAERAAESQMLNRGYSLQSTILKVGHHGSRTSTTQSFLNYVNPDAAVIMCGLNNRYGHPHQETLQKLDAAGVDIFRTDIHGTIVITTDGQTYQVNNKPYAYQQHPQQPPPASDSEQTGGKVNINTATLEALQQIVHIGPVRAQQIIDLRPFSSLDELTKVSGIGPVRLQDIKDQGIAYVQ